MSEATISFAEEVQAYGWTARDSSGILSPFHFTRRYVKNTYRCMLLPIHAHIVINLCLICRTNGGNDIIMKILYCGIYHSDLHLAKNEVGTSRYPLLPGYVLY